MHHRAMGGTERDGLSDTPSASTRPQSRLPGLHVGSLNIRSVNKKSASISDIIETSSLDILALQETWHEHSDSLSLRRAVPPGYCVDETARDAKITDRLQARYSLGGGVAIIYRSEFKAKKLTTLPQCKTFELVCCRLHSTRAGDVIVLSVYRPGSKPLSSIFFSEFISLLESLATFRCPILLLGDLNIRLDRTSDARVCEFNDILSSFDMCQCVQQATHTAGGLLDVVIVRQTELVKDVEVSVTGVSDHSLVTCRLPLRECSVESIEVEGRKWNKFSIDAFRADLLNSVLCKNVEWTKSMSVDELFNIYNVELTDLLDRHAPRYTRRRKKRILTPWFDDECRQMKRRVRVLERKYRKSHDVADRLAWVKKLQEQGHFYQEKERCYWSRRINSNAGNARRLWRDLNDLMKRDDSSANGANQASTPAEATELAENFMKFFNDKVESVRTETNNSPLPTFKSESTGNVFTCFKTIAPADTVKLINSAPNKHCSLDPVPTDILKTCSDLLAGFITEMFNRSIAEGHLPKSQKVAYVIPHLKKRGLDESDFKSYRPVSNLSLIAKLLERFVASQLNEFLLSTDALPMLQSAYRRFHSTETALLKVFSDMCDAIDNGNTCLLGLLDLSAAFDTVDHDILLSRLEITFGIKGIALQWFKSYLSERTQAVNINGNRSNFVNLRHGVPQGSVLGPLLFLLYSAPVGDIIAQHGLLHHCYADDTQIYFFCPKDHKSVLVTRFANCIHDVEQWMCSNRLKLNCDKTELVWISSGHVSPSNSPSTLSTITIGNNAVIPSKGARNLGLYFDQHLDLKQHVNNVCRLCYFQLRQLRVIRRTLSTDVLKTLLHAFVSTRLDYCNSLFYGLPKMDLRKLQMVQNSAARLFGGLRKFDHITPVLKNLHWLPIKERIYFKIAVLTYKSLHQMAPGYLSAMIRPVAQSSHLSRNRSAVRGDLLGYNWNTVSYGQRGYQYSSPCVWNNLPASIRCADTLTAFRAGVKTYLFRRAYKLTN